VLYQRKYNQFVQLVKKYTMSDCCNEINECECCPVGYVGIYDECGKFAGCVTPQEAKDYNNTKKECAVGYVKVEHPVTGDYVGCIAPADVPALIAALTPVITLNVSTSNVLCNGESNGTANVQIIGGVAPYTVSYSGGADPAALAAGNYVVTVTDANSDSSAYAFSIVEPDVLAVTVDTVGVIGLESTGTATANPTGGVSPYTYVWKDNLGIEIGQYSRTATGLAAGTYQVEVTDANGCIVEDTNVIIALIG